ncbi:MAG: DUF5989 family protein [Roseibacillus sp.]|jgi:hypothetical protein
MSDQGDQSKRNEFVEASKDAKTGFLAEMVGFLKDNKRWWLTPIVVFLLLLGALLILASTGAAPFIYTLF